MKTTIALIITLVSISSTVYANDGVLTVRGSTIISNAAGTARTVLVSNAVYVSSTSELKNVDVSHSFDVLFSTVSGPQAIECSDAIVTLTAGEGNFLPLSDGDDNYFMPELISFTCVK